MDIQPGGPADMTDACPCGSGKTLDACCGPIIAGAPVPTAEALMRSRYTAFVRGDLDHVERTHAPEARDGFDRAEMERWARAVDWRGLTIRSSEGGGPEDETGAVEFVARYAEKGGKPQAHHERSTFRREDGRWLYVDGEFNPKGKPVRVEKVGRNDPCPCGSGRKYKKCCGA
jgi:SEC-C motif-containing protein